MTLTLKNNLSVFVGIPSLSRNDKYKSYTPSVLSHLKKQKCSVEIREPYITPDHAGKFNVGQPDRLHAIAGRMNDVVDKGMQSDASHIFINDMDVEIPSNCIESLLKLDVDVASGVYPFHNFVKRTEDENPCRAMMFGRMRKDSQCGNMRPRDWDYMKEKVWGEDEPWTGGTGCILIKRRVFEKYNPQLTALRFNKDNDCGMDMLFWKRCHDMGFSTRVDANIVSGHLPYYKLKDKKEWLK